MKDLQTEALLAAARLSFVNSSGKSANISDGSDISLAVNGNSTDKIVFHSFSDDMNGDGLQHVLSGVEPGGKAITVGFEDLTGVRRALGPRDAVLKEMVQNSAQILSARKSGDRGGVT